MHLALKRVNGYYGSIRVLRDVDLAVAGGEILCLLGRNGAGKTTLLRAIMGQVRREGDILLEGRPIGGLKPHEIPRRGIGYVPQGRRLFAELTVTENLEIGIMATRRDRTAMHEALEFFPPLADRLHQVAGTLSGGEQQMLAMARALCLKPSVLLLDEPTEGLMPSMVAGIRDVILRLRDGGVAVLLVEQRVDTVMPVADRVAFLETGVLRLDARRAEVEADPGLLRRYLGV